MGEMGEELTDWMDILNLVKTAPVVVNDNIFEFTLP